jgi:hypothetical protein
VYVLTNYRQQNPKNSQNQTTKTETLPFLCVTTTTCNRTVDGINVLHLAVDVEISTA